MSRYVMLMISMYLLCAVMQAQTNHTLSGIIRDEQGRTVSGAAAMVMPSAHGCVSDNKGFYSIEYLETGSHIIEISFVGFSTHTDTITIQENTVYDVSLMTLPVDLDVFVVTENHGATLKRQESLQLEIVDAVFIQQNLAGSFMKSLESLPGLSQIEIGSGNAKPVIRGLGFNRVLVLENGIRHEGQQWGSDHGLEIDQHAVENVHVIKGPASFLYGSDAMGGVIHIKQNSVPEKNTIDGALAFTGRSVNDLWGLSAAANVRKGDVYFKSRYTYNSYADYRVPADSVSIYSYRWPLKNGRLRNTAGNDRAFHFTTGLLKSNFVSSLFFSIVDNESGFFANARGLEPRNVDTLLHDKSHRDILLPSQNVRHLKIVSQSVCNLPVGSLELEFGFQNNKRSEYGPYNQHGYMPFEPPDSYSHEPDLELWLHKNVFSGNIRHILPIREKHLLTVGVSGEYQNNKQEGWGFIIPDFTQQAAALFIYDRFKYSEKLIIHAGARYDAGRLGIEAYKDWFETPVISSMGDTTGFAFVTRAEALQRDFHNFSWALGFSYNSGAYNFKGHIGKSFRMPIAKELSTNGVNYHNFSYEKGNTALTAETAYQLDVAFEYTGHQTSFGLSPFINYFPNYIYLTPSHLHDYLYGAGNQIFYYTQNEVFQAGGEFFVRQHFSKKLTAALNGEYVYARQMSGDKTGFSLPFTPPASALISLDYTFNDRFVMQKPYFGISSRLTAPQNRIVPPERKTDGYYIFNMTAGTSLSLGKHNINIYFQINNLLNLNYMSHVNYYRLIGLPEAGRNFAVYLQIPFKTNNKHN